MRAAAVALVLITMLVVLAAKVPATLVIPENHYLTQKRVEAIQAVRGTVWDGQMLLAGRQKKNRYLLEWSVQKSCLLMMDFCVDVKIKSFHQTSRPGELNASLNVPLAASLFRQTCAPFSSFELEHLNGVLTPQMIQLVVPELVDSESDLVLNDVNLIVDLDKGLLESASGQISMDAGAVKFMNNRQLMRQNLSALSGTIDHVNTAETGYQLQLRDSRNRNYLGIQTSATGEGFNFIVYDLFARAFGAPPLRGQSGNPPRFEISQKIGDMICSQ